MSHAAGLTVEKQPCCCAIVISSNWSLGAVRSCVTGVSRCLLHSGRHPLQTEGNQKTGCHAGRLSRWPEQCAEIACDQPLPCPLANKQDSPCYRAQQQTSGCHTRSLLQQAHADTRQLHRQISDILLHLLQLLCCVVCTLNLLVCQRLIQMLLPTAARVHLLISEQSAVSQRGTAL